MPLFFRIYEHWHKRVIHPLGGFLLYLPTSIKQELFHTSPHSFSSSYPGLLSFPIAPRGTSLPSFRSWLKCHLFKESFPKLPIKTKFPCDGFLCSTLILVIQSSPSLGNKSGLPFNHIKCGIMLE